MKPTKSLLEYLDHRLGTHVGSGPEFVFHCPVCIDRTGSDSNKRKLAINLDIRQGRCFRCEFRFRDLARLFRYLNNGHLTVEERILLSEDPPIVVGSVSDTVRAIFNDNDDVHEAARPLRATPLPREYVPLYPRSRSPALNRPYLYLSQRGVDERQIRRFRIGYCATGKYAGYLIFPVVQGGDVVYWTNRFAAKHTRLKSNNPPKRAGHFSREHCLLNYDNVVGKRVVSLVEGPFDCMAPRHAIGLMGRTMSVFQARLIRGLVKLGLEELVLLLDPGTGEDIDAIRSALLDSVPLIRVLNLGHGDPDSRKQDLPALFPTRRVPTLSDRVRLRLSTK